MGSNEDEGFLIGLATQYEGKEALIGAVVKAGKANLMNLLLSMDEQGKLSYRK
jgi:hypothetical protein